MSEKPKTAYRRAARKKALQGLYQQQFVETSLLDLEAQFRENSSLDKVDVEYFREIISGVNAQQDELESALALHLDIPFEQLDRVEAVVLLLGVWELKTRHDVPYKVVINEAIELTKIFGAEGAHKFVNGTLDKLVADLRSLELS